MSHDQAVINRIWSETLLTELSRFGVKHVCIAPGSRSTPLTLEAADNPNFTIHTHFDERGLGFMALGLAKASQSPIAVIVTSGTAVANLLPAVAEAKLTGEKLVLLTADRPIELVSCGANQAIDQLGIFSQHVTASLNLPSPTLNTSLNWLLTSIDEVMFAQQQSGSAVHINCAFPEPLYSTGTKAEYNTYISTLTAWRESSTTYTTRFSTFVGRDIPSCANKKGVVLIGSLPLVEAQAALSFADEMGWPVFADPQSGVSSDWAHYDLWLSVPSLAQLLASCDLIIQFGSRIISKRLNQWIETHVTHGRQVEYWYISEHSSRNNQSHLPQLHWVESPKNWIARVDGSVATESGWASQLKTDIKLIQQQIHDVFLSSSTCDLNEVALAVDIEQRTNTMDVFLGNSLFIRLVDMFGRLTHTEVFSNRGASGIDGVLATASGVQRSRSNPLLVYIGDTSALYDLNSLSLFSHNDQATVIVITNNDGGAIFDMLPVPKEHLQTYYQMPHGYQFEHAAKQFGLSYQQPKTLEQYQTIVTEHFEHGQGTLVVEVQTPPNQAVELIKAFNSNLHAQF